jgi:hypothetical protein
LIKAKALLLNETSGLSVKGLRSHIPTLGRHELATPILAVCSAHLQYSHAAMAVPKVRGTFLLRLVRTRCILRRRNGKLIKINGVGIRCWYFIKPVFQRRVVQPAFQPPGSIRDTASWDLEVQAFSLGTKIYSVGAFRRIPQEGPPVSHHDSFHVVGGGRLRLCVAMYQASLALNEVREKPQALSRTGPCVNWLTTPATTGSSTPKSDQLVVASAPSSHFPQISSPG